MKDTMSTKRIIDFYKKYFTQVKDELNSEEEIILVPDETFSNEDNEVINYLEMKNISFTNKEILEMINTNNLKDLEIA